MVFSDRSGNSDHQLSMSAHEIASLGERIQSLHDEICRFEPGIDRMACALYDAEMDLLKTFVNSTHKGEPLQAYQYKLSDSPSLMHLAQSGEDRVIDDMREQLDSQSEHTRWLLSQGYRSSYTVPLFVNSQLEGFLFLDSVQPALFTPQVTAQLAVYGRLVALMICHEATAVRSLVGSVRIAREFAHLRDVETGTHLDRMSRYCRIIARSLVDSHGLSDEFVEQVFLFSPLHDIGKIGVPDAVLRKGGSFTPEERLEMMSHVTKGAEMVERLVRDFRLGSLAGVRVLRNLVGGHHEYLDGSGYPNGWRGEQIPIEARIVTVADIFDALSSKRVYKPRWTVEEAVVRLDEMVAQGKLDATCVCGLTAHLDEVREVMERFAE